MSEKWKNIPNGGFPNIYKIDTESNGNENENLTKKKREKSVPFKTLSIKDILLKKRHLEPFIPYLLEDK